MEIKEWIKVGEKFRNKISPRTFHPVRVKPVSVHKNDRNFLRLLHVINVAIQLNFIFEYLLLLTWRWKSDFPSDDWWRRPPVIHFINSHRPLLHVVFSDAPHRSLLIMETMNDVIFIRLSNDEKEASKDNTIHISVRWNKANKNKQKLYLIQYFFPSDSLCVVGRRSYWNKKLNLWNDKERDNVEKGIIDRYHHIF